MTDIHPAAADVLAAIRRLADYQPTSPQDTAHLIHSIAGDGTGDTNLVTELYRAVTRAAVLNPAITALPAPARRYLKEAAWYAEMVATQQAGDYIGSALGLLEQPGTVPAKDFCAAFDLPVDEPEPAPRPAPAPAAAVSRRELAEATT